jgi:hypothetical protein
MSILGKGQSALAEMLEQQTDRNNSGAYDRLMQKHKAQLEQKMKEEMAKPQTVFGIIDDPIVKPKPKVPNGPPKTKFTPSNLINKIMEMDKCPTQEEWDELKSFAETVVAKTVVRYAKMGKRPPEMDYYDGEAEEARVAQHAMDAARYSTAMSSAQPVNSTSRNSKPGVIVNFDTP